MDNCELARLVEDVMQELLVQLRDVQNDNIFKTINVQPNRRQSYGATPVDSFSVFRRRNVRSCKFAQKCMPIKGSETSWIWFPCGHQKTDLKSRIFIVHGCKCIDRHHPVARVTSVLVWWFKLVSGVSNAKAKYNKIKHFLRLGYICFNSAKPMQDGSYIPWYYLRKASRACSTTSFPQIPEFNKVYTHYLQGNIGNV